MASFSGGSLIEAVEELLDSKIVYDEETFQEALYDFGSSSNLAAAMAGTRDKKSKAYKAALRKVDFYKAGTRKPSAKTKAQIIEAQKSSPKAQQRRLNAIKSLKVTISGYWNKSRDKRFRQVSSRIRSPKRFIKSVLKNEDKGMDQFLGDYGVDDAFFTDYNVLIEEI